MIYPVNKNYYYKVGSVQMIAYPELRKFIRVVDVDVYRNGTENVISHFTVRGDTYKAALKKAHKMARRVIA